MGERLNQIKEIQKFLTKSISLAGELLPIIHKTTDKNFKGILAKFLQAYATLNYSLSIYILTKIPDSCKSDLIDFDFNKLMKPLEDDFKKKGNNG